MLKNSCPFPVVSDTAFNVILWLKLLLYDLLPTFDIN